MINLTKAEHMELFVRMSVAASLNEAAVCVCFLYIFKKKSSWLFSTSLDHVQFIVWFAVTGIGLVNSAC